MSRIENFHSLCEVLEQNDEDFEDLTLSPKERQALLKDLSNPVIEQNAAAVLADYFHIKVPFATIQQVLASDLKMAYEVYTDSVRDTWARDGFIDMVLKKIGLPSWPHNGASEKTSQEFIQQLKEKVQAGEVQVLQPKSSPVAQPPKPSI